MGWPFERIARLLVETFDAPACSYYSNNAGGTEQKAWPPEHFAGHLEEAMQWAEHRAPAEHPVLRYYIATGNSDCMQVADVPTRFADHRIRQAWAERARNWGGVEAQLALPTFFTRGEQRSFIVGRTHPYSEGEMQLARRLQRLLAGLDRQISTFVRYVGNGAGVADAAGSLQLTPRELVVLGLAAEGLTAAAIGRRLVIAEKTAEKHLEHIYGKLNVNSRLTAVQRARRIGLIPGF